METEPTAGPHVTADRDTSAPGNRGLKTDALGYISNLVISVALVAPAYSLAATLGFIVAVAGVGVHAPAVLIVSFIPILFVSLAYRFFLAAAILGLFCAFTRRSLQFPRWSHIWMAMQALCLFCGNYILFYYAGFHVVSGLLALCF